jgi:hypothetical protein
VGNFVAPVAWRAPSWFRLVVCRSRARIDSRVALVAPKTGDGMTIHSPARFLMCRPDHYAVTYSINPWMDPANWSKNGRALAKAARQEWVALRRTLLQLGATVHLVPPVAGLPDLVFTANSAVVLDGKALLARFRHAERNGEEPHYAAASPSRRCPPDWCSKAPATAFGTRRAICSGWDAASVRTWRRARLSKTRSASRWSRSS